MSVSQKTTVAAASAAVTFAGSICHLGGPEVGWFALLESYSKTELILLMHCPRHNRVCASP
jgi:hypothetical protein